MEPSIYAFVRRYSGRQQLTILGLAVALLPLNYATLELPKAIVNRVLGENADATFLGQAYDKVDLLWILCGLFLAAVIVSGGLKYVVNVYAGIVAERMLRRLRYQLYSHVLRFPLPHFRRVSQGELVQMINAETEALGGFVGEAVSTPAVQGGLLLTSLFFIFVQDPVLGLAAVALYPIQIWLIPKLQAQVNALGKRRVHQVRRNAERISESVVGVRDIHTHAGSRYERTRFSAQLGEVFWIRFAIYKKKFLIKFLNNFIAQLGPFFFFSIGGYLVLQGDISLGALVAVVGAQKEIASPWRELLTYYQTLFDVKIKYDQTVTQFVPAGLKDEALLDAEPDPPPDLDGPLQASNLTVTEETGEPVLEHVSFTVPLPAHVAILGPAGAGKEELTLALAGLVAPSSGRVTLNGHDLAGLPEPVLGRVLAFVGTPAYVFAGTIADNLLYGLRHRPLAGPSGSDDARSPRERLEAERSGNSPFDPNADWDDFRRIGIEGPEARLAAMVEALEVAALAGDVYGMGLRSRLPDGCEADVIERLLDARRLTRERLAADPGLGRLVEPFDPGRYNANASLAENLLFGTPVGEVFDHGRLARQPDVVGTLRAVGLLDELHRVGFKVAQTMVELFADLPPDHEYFRQFNFVAAEDLPDVRALVSRGDPERLGALSEADRDRLLALAFKLVAARHRLGLVTEPLMARVVEARAHFRANLPADLASAIDFFEPDRFNEASSVQDNILFGRVAYGQSQAQRRVGAIVDAVVDELRLRPAITEVGLSGPCGFGGSRLSPPQRQKLAVARAVLKRPDILVLDDALAALDSAEQVRVRDNLLEAFKDRTVIAALQHADWADRFGTVIELDRGRLKEMRAAAPDQAGPPPDAGETDADARAAAE